jgi:hypothetical protein
MRLYSSLVATAALTLLPAVNAEPLIGYGTTAYNSFCAFACRFSVPTALDCPEYKGMNDTEIAAAYPTPACFAQDTPYLSSVAWCIHQTCENDTKMSTIDEFWEKDVFYGADEPGIVLKYTYYEALSQVNKSNPPEPLGPTDLVLNRTVEITPKVYQGYYNAVKGASIIAKNEAMYS